MFKTNDKKVELEDFEKYYYLHDSSLNKIYYDDEEKILILYSELAENLQDSFSRDVDGQTSIGAFLFTEVVSFKNMSYFSDDVKEKPKTNQDCFGDERFLYGKIIKENHRYVLEIATTPYSKENPVKHRQLFIEAASVKWTNIYRYDDFGVIGE